MYINKLMFIVCTIIIFMLDFRLSLSCEAIESARVLCSHNIQIDTVMKINFFCLIAVVVVVSVVIVVADVDAFALIDLINAGSTSKSMMCIHCTVWIL